MPDFPGPAPSPAPVPTSTVYSERLTLGPLGWVLMVVFASMLGIAFVPVDVRLAVLVGTAAVVGGVVVFVRTAPVVRVDATTLQAGRARIPLTLVGAASPLDSAATRAELGPRLDARAYLCLRGWIHTAVKVELVDPLDPTPYWIVSTRRPEALAGALIGS
ncbi:DUF3093 domain-containing protein [Cellulomonas sp. URHE0023]|uniref:DUF3093 domain-containing protein n=1 Tax=Cellulomonas sp. URHE0023 TaxID=1380354 RepID=UPI000480E375|nr:DUF3093 domain-containing protein [Cellulomonas sp. URHE0023]